MLKQKTSTETNLKETNVQINLPKLITLFLSVFGKNTKGVNFQRNKLRRN